MIKSAIIAAAGRGTRLMPSTKETPKEMLPIVDNGQVKPILHLIIDQIANAGINKMFVITGREKRAIEDHFTQNYSVLEQLTDKDILAAIEGFYKTLSIVRLSYINQPRPEGFGAAAYLGKEYVSHEDSFYMTSGDSIIYSLKNGPSNDFIKRLMDAHEKTDADATIAVFETDTPKRYGIAVTEPGDGETFNVKQVVEKPDEPPSNLAICGKYIFKPTIFNALEKIGVGVGGEKQLTDAIEWLIENGGKVTAIKLKPDEIYMDVGNPKTYIEAFVTTSMFDSKMKSFTKEKFEKLLNFYKENGKD